MYLGADVARSLANDDAALADLAALLADERIDPFTFNAFPYGDFHRSGLKERVFEPTWCDEARLEYTLAVARVASHWNARRGEHVSISTHPGRFGAWEPGEFDCAARNLARCVEAFARLEDESGVRLVLALEAEPRAVAGETQELSDLLERLTTTIDAQLGADLCARHLGSCLDACHSAVEFEEPASAAHLATRGPLGKLQYSSALVLKAPGESDAARKALFGLDEPRYLHQTTGRHGDQLLRVDDLPELRAACADPASAWLACDEWRTHFHVPLDRDTVGDTGPGAAGLATTREHAANILDELLAAPDRWRSPELHVEIETYTWDILPAATRGAGSIVDCLAREYAVVLERLERAGWRPGADR